MSIKIYCENCGQFTFNFFKERKRLLEEKLQEFK